MIHEFEWVDARTLDEALAALDGKSVPKAGGIDLLDLMKEEILAPPRVVNLRRIPGLDAIAFDAKSGLSIGPLVTLTRLATDETVLRNAPLLAKAAGLAAHPQIRNQATLGGNILQRPRCWYFRSAETVCLKKGGDKCFAQNGENQYHAIFGNSVCAIIHPSTPSTALVALGARLRLRGAKGEREALLEEFFLSPDEDVTRENRLAQGELIVGVNIPAPAARTRYAYVKLGEKESFDWPLAEVAVVLGGGKASVVLGAAAPVPYRAKAAEALLAGGAIDEKTATEAADAAMRGATPLSQNAYKIPIFRALVRRTILAAANGPGGE